MTAAILVAWALSGTIAARALATEADWWRWAPISVFFGPLWLAVAAEQRSQPREIR